MSTVDVNGSIHDHAGQFAGHIQTEGDPDAVLQEVPALLTGAEGDSLEGEDGIELHLRVSRQGQARSWRAYRMDSNPSDEFDDVPHFVGGPARRRDDGTLEWHNWGELHNDEGPAVVRPDGTTEFWLYGQRYDSEQWENIAPAQREQVQAASARGKTIFDTYAAAHDPNEEPEAVIRDMVTDLAHYWRSQGLDIEDLLQAGFDRVDDELTDPVV